MMKFIQESLIYMLIVVISMFVIVMWVMQIGVNMYQNNTLNQLQERQGIIIEKFEKRLEWEIELMRLNPKLNLPDKGR